MGRTKASLSEVHLASMSHVCVKGHVGKTCHHVAPVPSGTPVLLGTKNILYAGGLAIRKREGKEGLWGRGDGFAPSSGWMYGTGSLSLKPQQRDSYLTGTSLRTGAIPFPTESPVPGSRKGH